ncbi:UDP-galactose transporter 1 [Colletotrichum chlorophyti]|uniref:UDP-galactose transporter 1 n=1 Tax=Colletotrichum chlorophyti TaxID=708187 RepID=A0A1Q8S237_9PEZI|nr:UDP-galactose transporter 1 [Colletotrichum chlorophyti]
MLSQVKLILTPIFGLLLLKQTLSQMQWGRLIIMTMGIMLVQLGTATEFSGLKNHGRGQEIAIGVILMVIAGFCVALAGVYIEACFKSNGSFMARNAQLAGYSCVFALLCITMQSGKGIDDFFRGYNPSVWVLVVLQAAGGFIVSWSVRITSTVAKNYAQGLGFLAASAIPLLSVGGNYKFYIGALCVLWGVFGSLWSAKMAKSSPSREQEKKEGHESIV